MERASIRFRLVRAFSGKTQEDFAAGMGSDPSSVGRWELGLAPLPEQEKRAVDSVGLTLEWADEAIELAERHRQRRRPGQGVDDLLGEIGKAADGSARELVQRLLSLPLQPALPRHEERLEARAEVPRLAKLSPAQRAAVVRLGRDYHPWALCIEAGEASAETVSKDLAEATLLSDMASEFAALVEGPKGWPEAVKSHAVAYRANLLRSPGKLKDARTAMEEAKRLAKAGSDPYGLLDPGRLLELEASLCRAERRFKPALKLLDDAAAVGHCPARALINKGATLAVMGEYEQAIKVLRDAEPEVERAGDTRLSYMWRFNLAVNLTHLSEFAVAAQHLEEVRRLATEREDEIELIRVTWLEGRLQRGLGRRAVARFYLEQAAGQFEAKERWYDVALARTELAGLHLEEGRTAEVKAVTPALAAAFEVEGVHTEALKALRLFQAAVDREEATAELARKVLAFLFRAQHDPALRYA
jgi:tetratricopeptide (TPR) repeat protein